VNAVAPWSTGGQMPAGLCAATTRTRCIGCGRSPHPPTRPP
jgi:hypothetical protein